MTSGRLTLRRATIDDAPALAQNHLRAYPGGHGLAEREERFRAQRLFPLDTMTVAERGGVVVGQARTMPFRGWFGGVEATVGGLAGVAVAPEARRTGVARALILEHIARCRSVAPGDVAASWSILYPFAPRFYAAYGWAVAVQRMRWRFPPAALPAYPERELVSRLSLADPDDRDAVQRAYHRMCAVTNGSLSRSDTWLRWEWSEDRHFAVGVRTGAEPGASLDGYLFYKMYNPTPRPQILIAHQLVALSPRALRALLGFLGAHVEQADEILLDTPPGHGVAAILDRGLPPREDPEMPAEHHPLGTLYSGYMARAVDLAGALVTRGYPAGATASVAFAARDRLVPENEAPLTLHVVQGKARVQPGRAALTPCVSGEIGAISAILVGALRLRDACALGRVTVEPRPAPHGEGDDLAALDALFALPPPSCEIIF